MPEEQFPVAGQPYIYAGVEKAPGNGKKLLFVKTHGRTALHVTVSKQDYETMLRDGGWRPEPVPCVPPMNCPSCNHSVTPNATGNGDEVECPGCGHRWPLYREF